MEAENEKNISNLEKSLISCKYIQCSFKFVVLVGHKNQLLI